jgi:hypothetical protein
MDAVALAVRGNITGPASIQISTAVQVLGCHRYTGHLTASICLCAELLYVLLSSLGLAPSICQA